jgi:protein phosphatase
MKDLLRYLWPQRKERQGPPARDEKNTVETSSEDDSVEQDLEQLDSIEVEPQQTDCLRVAAATHRGRKRNKNEDAFFCDVGRGLFLVADGMGGQAAGEQASAIAKEVLSSTLGAQRLEEIISANEVGCVAQVLEDALRKANATILDRAAQNTKWKGMGSTAVVAVLYDSSLHVANLGDSRAYLIRDREARLLTEDHSLAAVLVEKKKLGAEEARSHSSRNQLTACLGMRNSKPASYAKESLRPQDCIILCSDGLWDMVPDTEIARIAAMAPDPTAAAEAYVRAANEAGGQDNITVVVIVVEDTPIKVRPPSGARGALPVEV